MAPLLTLFAANISKCWKTLLPQTAAPYAADGQNLLNKSTVQRKRALAIRQAWDRDGPSSPLRLYLLRLMTGLDSLSEVITISRLLMSSAFLSSEIVMPSLASKCWITSSMMASAFSTM